MQSACQDKLEPDKLLFLRGETRKKEIVPNESPLSRQRDAAGSDLGRFSFRPGKVDLGSAHVVAAIHIQDVPGDVTGHG